MKSTLLIRALVEADDRKRFAAVVVLRNPQDPETLLVRREYDPEKGKWACPGGHCEVGEEFEDACRRELKEETGVEAGELHPLGEVGDGQNQTQLFWCVVDDDQDAKVGDDADKAAWTSVSKLPELAFGNNEHVEDAMNQAFKRRRISAQEAIKWVNGRAVYTRDAEQRRNPEAQRHQMFPGQILTKRRWAASSYKRGDPDPRLVSQRVDVTRGKSGPIVAKNIKDISATRDVVGNPSARFDAIYVFKRASDIPSDQLDAIKRMGFEGAEDMLKDAAEYIAEAVKYMHFDALMPILSSKPLASRLSDKVSEMTGIPVWKGEWEKKAVAKDTSVSKRWSTELFGLKSKPMDVPNSILVIDDFITSRQSFVEVAKKLYNAGAIYVAGAALCGRESGKSDEQKQKEKEEKEQKANIRPVYTEPEYVPLAKRLSQQQPARHSRFV